MTTTPDQARLITNGVGCEHHYDIGQGYRLAWTVGPDGDAWPMLQDTRVTGTQFVPYNPAQFDDIAPHEKVGALPRETRERLGLVCGWPRRNGQPCRMSVSEHGQRCTHHREGAR